MGVQERRGSNSSSSSSKKTSDTKNCGSGEKRVTNVLKFLKKSKLITTTKRH